MKIINYLYCYFGYFFFAKIKYGFPKVRSIEETIDNICSSNKALCRFGDGEFNLIHGAGNGFQEPDEELSDRLSEILKEGSSSTHIVTIPGVFSFSTDMKLSSALTWRRLIRMFYPRIHYLINKDFLYDNTQVTRPYIDYKKNSHSEYVFACFKRLFKDKKVLIIEGEDTKLGVGNDLLSGCLIVRRVTCPNRNSFSFYDTIYHTSAGLSKDYDLVLIALGPTATVLAWDLGKIGVRALDVGHLDIEYEWYKSLAKKKTLIKGKNVNELGCNAPEETVSAELLDNYQSEILEKIK